MIGIEELHSPEFFRIPSERIRSVKHNGLVTAETGALVDLMRVYPPVAEVLSCPYHEEGEDLRKEIEPFEIKIAPVHNIKGSRLGRQVIQDIYIPYLGVCNLNE